MSEQTIEGSIQTFERGLMIWRSDNGDIFALADNGDAYRFTEPAYGRWADNPMLDSGPTGRVRPINGFGKVWGNRQAVRDALGWAMLTERGVSMSVRDTFGIIYLTFPGQSEMRINLATGIWAKDDAPAPPVVPPVDDGQFITVEQHKAALEALRVQMLQQMDARLTAHIERSLNIDEIMAHMISLLRSKPTATTSAQLLKDKET